MLLLNLYKAILEVDLLTEKVQVLKTMGVQNTIVSRQYASTSGSVAQNVRAVGYRIRKTGVA